MAGLGIALAAALVVAVLVPSLLFAGWATSSPSLESGAEDTADFDFTQPVDAPPAHDGIELKVTGIVADETQTEVSYVLNGREDEGMVECGSGTFLFDANGKSHRSTTGSRDQTNPRQAVAIFPPIPAKRGVLALQLENLYVNGREVYGTWRAEFDWDGNKASPGPPVEVPAAPQPFGPGSISITSIQQVATGTVISGVLDGFTADAIQNMDCMAGPLITADAASIPWINCRGGFGEGYRSFEIRYPPTSGKVSLNFVLKFSAHGPPEPPLSPGYAEAVGAKASFDLELPAR